MSNENVTNQVLWLIMLKHECSGFNHALFFICSMRQAVRNKVPKGWDPTYTRSSFFPYWRSVLGARCRMKMYAAYAAADGKSVIAFAQLRDKLTNGPSVSNNTLGVAGRIWQRQLLINQECTVLLRSKHL